MAVFLDNTIYTNHALEKIGRNLIGDYEDFNFLKIKIGSGDNTLSMDRTELSVNLYTLRIGEVHYADGIITIKCEIPPELAEVPITEIGLFDTVLGVEYLFSYSKVEITKPADLGYELTIVLNLGPRTIDFPGVNVFHVPSETYATRESLDNFTDMFIYIDTNLERVIHSNAEILGYNMAEVAYERQLKLKNILTESSYANLYYSLYGRYRDLLSDLYFINEPNYLSYDIVNFARDNSYLDTHLGLFESFNDGFTLHQGPITFAWSMQLDDITKTSTIFNKRSDLNLYFSIDTASNYEIYKVESTESGVPEYHRELYYEMLITLYGLSNSYVIKYIFNTYKKGDYMGQQVPYILTFNGDFENPELHLYVDGVEPEILNEPSDLDSKEVQDARQESDLFNKIQYDNAIKLLDMPDYSAMCHLRNYLTDLNTEEKYNYDNAMNTKVLLALKKQATKHDVAFLSSVLRSLGELN